MRGSLHLVNVLRHIYSESRPSYHQLYAMMPAAMSSSVWVGLLGLTKMCTSNIQRNLSLLLLTILILSLYTQWLGRSGILVRMLQYPHHIEATATIAFILSMAIIMGLNVRSYSRYRCNIIMVHLQYYAVCHLIFSSPHFPGFPRHFYPDGVHSNARLPCSGSP